MLKHSSTILILCLIISSCINNDPYGIKGLKKLDNDEIIQITIDNLDKEPGIPPIYRYESGKVVPLDTISKYDPQKWGYDYYANINDVIKVVIIRKPKREDSLFHKKLTAIIKEAQRPEVKLVDIDCHSIDKMLARIRFTDQENRTNQVVNESIDFENLTKVVSILEKCGMPTVEEVGNNGVNTVWLIILHASAKYRTKYFPLFIEAAEKGDLQPKQIAIMEDKIFQDSGKPQVYGSQVIFNTETGKMEVYSLLDPTNVNKRRKEVGLEPIESYMMQFSID